MVLEGAEFNACANGVLLETWEDQLLHVGEKLR